MDNSISFPHTYSQDSELFGWTSDREACLFAKS